MVINWAVIVLVTFEQAIHVFAYTTVLGYMQ